MTMSAMSIWLNEKALSVIDSMFWVADRESYVGDDDLPTWNTIRKAMGKPPIVHDPVHGFLPEGDHRIGTPSQWSNRECPALEGVTTTTASSVLMYEDLIGGREIR